MYNLYIQSYNRGICTVISTIYFSVADPDPGSGAFLTPGPGSQNHIFESLMAIFCIESYITLWKLAIQTQNNFQFCEICGYKKGMTKHFFSPLSFVAVFGSGIGKNQDPGSGINISDPQHWYICFTLLNNLVPHFFLPGLRLQSIKGWS